MFNRGTSQAGIRAELSHEVFASKPVTPGRARYSQSYDILGQMALESRNDWKSTKWGRTSVAVAWLLIEAALPGTEFAYGYCTTDEEETLGAAAWTATSAAVS